MMALYGLLWMMWWFFWMALEGGELTVELYGVTWAPVIAGFRTGGPFAWSRYPLAFGYLEFLWSLGFLVQSTTAVLKVVPIAIVVTLLWLRFVADRRRLRRYGDVYRRYMQHTPLLIPRIRTSAAIMQILRRRRRRQTSGRVDQRLGRSEHAPDEQATGQNHLSRSTAANIPPRRGLQGFAATWASRRNGSMMLPCSHCTEEHHEATMHPGH
jgi:hypothetical protein